MGGKTTNLEIYPKPDAEDSSIQLHGDTGSISLGSPGRTGGIDGKLLLYDSSEPYAIIALDAQSGSFVMSGSSGVSTITVDGHQASIVMHDDLDNERITLDGREALLKLMRGFGRGSVTLDGSNGSIFIEDDTLKKVLSLGLGIDGKLGQIVFQDNAGKESITLDGKGHISIKNTKGNSIVLDGTNNSIGLRNNWTGRYLVFLEGDTGRLTLRDEDGIQSLFLNGKSDEGFTELRIGSTGTKGKAGKIILLDSDIKESIVLDGAEGDIFLNNADCAEDFDILESEDISPGTVMVIEEQGKLQQCRKPYDKKVGGIVSGAGNCKPGIVLDKKSSQNEKRMPIALMGKVYCKVDASCGPIEVGDLLTTSSTPGHAMKATDSLKAFGAVIGKALSSLKTGTGLIPILVTLQ